MSDAPWRPARWWPALLLALCLLPFAFASVYHNDEFSYMSLARRVAEGQVLYRDFDWFVAPLSIWALAGAFKLFGFHLAVSHALSAAIIWLSGLQLTRLARRLGVDGPCAWLPAFGLALGLYTHWACFAQHWFVLPFELAALEAALVGLARPEARWWGGAGVACALAGLTIQPDGAGLALALAVGVLAAGRDLALRRLGALAAGIGATLAVFVLVLAVQGALGAAWDQIVRWPLTHYRVVGGFNDVAFATDLPQALSPVAAGMTWYARLYQVLATTFLLPAACLGAIAWALGRRVRPELATVAAFCATSWLVLAHGRADYVHASFYAVPGLLAAAVASHRVSALELPAGWVGLQRLPLAALIAFVATGAFAQVGLMRHEPEVWTRPWATDERIANSPAVAYVRTHARPGDTMAAAPYGGTFFFYGPRPATRVTHMVPPSVGYGSQAEYAAFWAELAANRPRFIVLSPYAAGGATPEQALAEFVRHLPPGYHLAARLDSPLYGGPWPAEIYERD